MLGAAGLIVPTAALLTLIGRTGAQAGPAQAGPAHAASAKSVTLTWHTFKLINGWVSASKTSLVTGKPGGAIHDGVIYFRGAIKQPNPGGSDTFALLPKYARPPHNLYIQVYTDGDVPGTGFVGLGGAVKPSGANAFIVPPLP